jgi:hypothetical protein
MEEVVSEVGGEDVAITVVIIAHVTAKVKSVDMLNLLSCNDKNFESELLHNK